MNKNEAFIKKIGEFLKKDIDGFIKAVGAEFNTNPFTIYGLNISVYLLKSERNGSNEEVYEVYSLDCSQNLAYYNSIWQKYLEIHNSKFSHFELNGHISKGWYDKDVVFPKEKKIFNCFKDLGQLEKEDNIILSDVEKEEKPNTESHFIKVDDGWIKFISDLETHNIQRAFNLSWVSSYIHIPNSEYLEFPKWYVSCYLLMDIADKISDKRFYKKAIRPAINKLLFNASLSFHELLIENKQQDIETAAVRAAISQVMARNMSHNIGSHVLSKFKDEKEIENPTSIKQYCQNNTLNFNFNNKNEQIAYFNEYLKNRMDFLADIATTDPVMETPMYLFRDILKGFDKNRILLNRISGVSTDRKFKIIVLDKNGNGINNLNHSDDPLLSIPNEILGAQAFYILMENIIRNIYKHGNPDKDIEIKIEVKDYEKDASFYEISIYDNIAKDSIDAAVINRNTAFNDSVLDKNKKALRPNNLGTIEMDVCAAYLRCLPIISIENTDFDLQENNETETPRLIYAYKHQLSDTGFSLGYKLCISKPKEILVVTNDKSSFSINGSKDEKELAKTGIRVIAKEELEKSEAIYNHQILYSLLNSDELEEILAKKQAMLPKRIVYSNEYISLDSAEKFIESVWEQYALRFFDENSHGYHFEWGEIQRIITGKENKISIAQNDKQYSSCENVFIDNHNKEWNMKRKTNESLNLYYDMACSHSKISKFLFNIFERCNKKLAVEYLEVLNTKIVLLDERIQSNIADSKTGRKYEANETQTPLMEYFEQQKLFIPKQSDCDLNQVSFGTLAESNCENGETVSTDICRYIKGQLTGTEQPDFVIIHLGILEKMLPSDKDKNLKDIDTLINCLFHEERKRLVVTSGRGKPNNLPDDIPFVPLALVQNAVETLFDKFLLTKILFNARKSV